MIQRRASRDLRRQVSMFGGSERAPAIQRRRNGPIVRPNVDVRYLGDKRGVCKRGAALGNNCDRRSPSEPNKCSPHCALCSVRESRRRPVHPEVSRRESDGIAELIVRCLRLGPTLHLVRCKIRSAIGARAEVERRRIKLGRCSPAMSSLLPVGFAIKHRLNTSWQGTALLSILDSLSCQRHELTPGLLKTHLTHVEPDRLAVDGRKLTPSCPTRALIIAIWICQQRAPTNHQDHN